MRHLVSRFIVALVVLGATGPALGQDTDGDGMPNAWEILYGLNPEIPNRQAGTGRDGPLSAEHGDTYTDNVWAQVLGTNAAGLATLNVSGANGFASNDLVLIITMQDPNTDLALNKAGIYEFGRIRSTTASTFTLAQPRSNAFTVTTSEKIQVLKVPEYTDVNFTGAALSFDGVDDCVDAADGVYFTGDFTVETWVKVRASANYARVLDFGNGPYQNNVICILSEGTTGKPALHLHHVGSFTPLTAPNPLPVNEWVHLAFTLSGTVGRIYVNGVEVTNSPTMYVPANVVRTNNYIGRSAWGNDAYAAAAYDEVRIWNVARSAADIARTMRQPLSGNEPGLVAYYRFNEGTGTVACDATSNHFDGVLTGGPTWEPLSGTLTCRPWNGTDGGVVAFLAHSVSLCNTAPGGSAPGTFWTGFESGIPANTTTYGVTYRASNGGVDNSACLHLTDPVDSQSGSWIINDLLPGRSVGAFTASFKFRVGGGGGAAEGISFCIANDLPTSGSGAEGAGSGLRICYDSYDNGGGEAPALDIKWGSTVVRWVPLGPPITDTDWRTVTVSMGADGMLDLVFSSLA
jgi:hypothetical protein